MDLAGEGRSSESGTKSGRRIQHMSNSREKELVGVGSSCGDDDENEISDVS